MNSGQFVSLNTPSTNRTIETSSRIVRKPRFMDVSLTGNTRPVDERDLRIRNHVYGSFVEHGRVRHAERGRHGRRPGRGGRRRGLRRLHDAHALVLQPGSTAIRMLNPFSAVETPHRVEAAGRSWYANCAWDALGIPHALHEGDARIESRCPDCGERLDLELRDGELVQGADLLVHFVVPARRWWDDIGFT